MPREMTFDELKRLKNRIRELKTKIIPKLVKRLKSAWADGDWPENNAFISANEELQQIQKELSRLKEAVRNVKIIKPSKGEIGIGSRIRLKIGDKDTIVELTTPLGADPLKNKISIESPLGKALIKSKPGDDIKLPTGQVVHVVEIL